MQTIKTKFLAPTNFRGSRYKATASSGMSVTLESDHRLNPEQNCVAAVVALLHKLGWTGVWVVGGGGECAVCVERTKSQAVAMTDWDYIESREQVSA